MMLLDAVDKATPSTSMVHRERPIGTKHKDDPGTDVLNPDTITPGLEDGIQDPFDYRDMNEDSLPTEKDDDDPGTQDVDPPNQDAMLMAPEDEIVPPDDNVNAVTKRISGNSPIELNAIGRRLANKLAERIAAKGCFDVLYSSTLPRGVETVRPILKACPTTKYAGADAALCPWHLGGYEGKEPEDVKGQIVYFIEHPDEVPLGTGADGKGAESFDAAKTRQLDFFRKLYADYTDDPTLKIAAQVHSRGLELLKAWVDADCPDDYDIDEDDVINPDDETHASVMRWHKDDIKDVDLDSDDPLKPGVYLVLHSLTDDDTDGGNPELEKYDENQPRDDHGRFGSGTDKLERAQTMHDRLKEHPGREQTPSEAAQSNFERGVSTLGDSLRTLAAHPAFNVKINRSGDKARGVMLSHIKQGDKARDQALSGKSRWRMDMALSHYHDALLTAGRVLGSKWVGKAFNPDQPRDDHGRFGSSPHEKIEGDIARAEALASKTGTRPDWLKQPQVFQSTHSSGNGPVTQSAVNWRKITAVSEPGRLEKIKDAWSSVADKTSGFASWDSISRAANLSVLDVAQELKAQHESDPNRLAFTVNRVGAGTYVKFKKSDVVKRVYMPPIEVHRAAKSADAAGVTVVGVTDALAKSEGLDIEHVQMVADFFATPESATMPPITRNAYGGEQAMRWATKVIAKAGTWTQWYGVDLDGTLAEKLDTYGPDGNEIGAPIKTMVDKVKSLLAQGKEVRVFTARVADDPGHKAERAIKSWCKDAVGRELPVTNEKDPGMVALWDDRAYNADEVNKAGSGVMVSFTLDSGTADNLAVPGGEDPKDMHVTLVYLGKLDGINPVGLRIHNVERAVREYAAMHAPVTGTIDGPVRFSAKPQTEGRDVHVAAFCNTGIQEFRAGLVAAIKAVGVDVPRVFDYRPHVTIKYIAPDDDMPTQRIEPQQVTFKELTLSVGGQRMMFPLSGTVIKYSPDQSRDNNGRFGTGGGKNRAPSRAEQDKAIAETKDQLKQISDLTGGKGADAYVLEHGKPYYMDAKSFNGPRGQARMCYQNSYQAATRNEGLTYVEGQVNIGLLSIPHAWTVDKQGNVRDSTLHAPSGKAVESKGYFGVPFDNEYLMKTALKTGVYGVISHTNRDLFKKSDDVGKYSPDQPRDDHGRWGAGDHAGTERDRIREVLNASDADPRVKAAEENNLRTGDSRLKPGVLDANSRYTPEAHAENKAISDSFLDPSAKPAPGEKPSAVFMVGKPGAGKSTTLAALKDTFPHSITINSDDIKEKISGYSPDRAGAYHERSCDIARNYLTPAVVNGGYNVVFDMTDNSERLMQSVDALKGAGYKVALIHSDVSDATSAERVYDRFLRTGRYVSVRTALSYSGRPKLAYDLAKTKVDQYREYDQNGKQPKLRESGGGGIF